MGELLNGGPSSPSLGQLMRLFHGEKFLLLWDSGASQARVALAEDAQGTDVVRLFALALELQESAPRDAAAATPGDAESQVETLQTALRSVDAWWPSFVRESRLSGWSFDTANVVVTLPEVRFRKGST